MTTEQRLERLERENRWMRRIGMMAAAVAAAVFLVGQGKREDGILQGKKVILRDTRNRERIVLDPDFEGVARIVMSDPSRNVRLTLNVLGEGTGEGTPSFSMYDRDHRAALTCEVSNEPSVALYDRRGKQKLHMNVLADSPKIELCDDAGGRARLRRRSARATPLRRQRPGHLESAQGLTPAHD